MAYGEIYNTTWWGVALDTARTAGTEPDFFGSQMKLLTSNQPELVTNGDFATDSGWSKETGWTISGGNANYNGNAALSAIYQNVVTSGVKYRVSFDVLNYVSGSFKVYLSDGGLTGDSPLITANGNYVFDITSTGVLILFRNVTSFIGSIDNVSVKEVRLDLDQIEAKKCLADWIHTTALQDLNN